jgi:hypothetical protein
MLWWHHYWVEYDARKAHVPGPKNAKKIALLLTTHATKNRPKPYIVYCTFLLKANRTT